MPAIEFEAWMRARAKMRARKAPAKPVKRKGQTLSPAATRKAKKGRSPLTS
jgi:hypothetical protein